MFNARGSTVPTTGTLHKLATVHPNPGALAGSVYVPAGLPSGAPLVVVLHGCTQTGVAYAAAAGWFALADRHAFAVLVPQQQRANNPNLCFNWFEPGDVARGQGETASIKAMIDSVIGNQAIDCTRVFVTGLSAGAAMANAMLAAYPEVFAGAGIIAGLPSGSAAGMASAMQTMRTATRDHGTQLGDKIRDASAHRGPWPRVSIWHGTRDHIVAPANGDAVVRQWIDVHALADTAPAVAGITGVRHRSWHDPAGIAQVEHIEVSGMGHGTPIDASDPLGGERPAPYVLDVGVSSSRHLLEFWGLAAKSSTRRAKADPVVGTALPFRPMSVETMINDALRAAGLVR